jgi:glycosyltransferase involved in cell wall biosynthesis
MTTYNRASYLQRSIGSVINQTFKQWELIVVDDGSNDFTFEYVNNLISTNNNIRYLKHSNRKTPLATNAGILASCGKLLAFIGSDDEWKPQHLQLRIDFFNSNPEIDFVHGGVEIIGVPFVKDKNDLTKEIHLSECIIGGTFFGKRDVFFQMNGFKNLDYSDDSDFFERVSERYKVAKVDFPTYVYYRDTPDSICSTIQ